MKPPRRVISAISCLAAAGILAAGCGNGSSPTPETAPAVNRPAPPASDFPSANGKTLAEILNTATTADVVVSPAAKVFREGPNRFPFGVFTVARQQVSNAQVALYFAKAPPLPRNGGEIRKEALSEARDRALNAPALGPYPAEVEVLTTKPAFRARTTSQDPDAASVVYVTNVNFPKQGEWRIVALIKKGSKLTGTLLPSVEVGAATKVPGVGDRAPFIHTPTATDAGGDLSKITTRIPPDTQNRVDYADALGREPIILLFATPQFCQSRVCGPVVDVSEQVKQGYGAKAAFIHMEIYKQNDPNSGVRRQVRAFHLPSEPWLFAIDRHGVVQAEIEGAFGISALTRAVKTVIGE